MRRAGRGGALGAERKDDHEIHHPGHVGGSAGGDGRRRGPGADGQRRREQQRGIQQYSHQACGAGQRGLRVRVRELQRQDRLPGVPAAAAAPVLVLRRDAVASCGCPGGGSGAIRVAVTVGIAVPVAVCFRLGLGFSDCCASLVLVISGGCFGVLVGYGDQHARSLTWCGRADPAAVLRPGRGARHARLRGTGGDHDRHGEGGGISGPAARMPWLRPAQLRRHGGAGWPPVRYPALRRASWWCLTCSRCCPPASPLRR